VLHAIVLHHLTASVAWPFASSYSQLDAPSAGIFRRPSPSS